MRCEQCGNDVEGSSKFCTKCGARVRTAQGQDAPTIQMTPVPPVPPAPPRPAASPRPTVVTRPPTGRPPYVPPAPVAQPKKKRTGLVIGIIVMVLLVLGGAAAGIVAWRISVANRMVAKVQSVDLELASGKQLDLKKVPLDEKLVLQTTYDAHFKDGGNGKLKVTVTDSEGSEVVGDSFVVISSDKPQKKQVEFHMTQSSGKPLKAQAQLEVSKGSKKATDTGSLSYTAVAGKGKEAQFAEAKGAALKKLTDATSAVKEIAALGINAADLTSMLSDATGKLAKATTAQQANEAGAVGDVVLAECASRKKSQQDSQARNADIAAAKQVMFDYANAEKGNAESISLTDFSMNNEGTVASATYVGFVTVHTDQDNAGQKDIFYVTAGKQNGQWVVTDFRYEFQ